VTRGGPTAGGLPAERLRPATVPTFPPGGVFELRNQSTTRPVRRNDDLFGIEIVQRLDPGVLLECNSLCRGEPGKATHETRRLQRSICRMEDRAAESRTQMRQFVAPVGGKAVVVQRLVLREDLRSLLVVGGQAQAPPVIPAPITATSTRSGDCTVTVGAGSSSQKGVVSTLRCYWSVR